MKRIMMIKMNECRVRRIVEQRILRLEDRVCGGGVLILVLARVFMGAVGTQVRQYQHRRCRQQRHSDRQRAKAVTHAARPFPLAAI